MLTKILGLAVAGAAGTLARYALAGTVHRMNAAAFPWGTLAVNLTGCFFAGLLWSLFENRWSVTSETRAIIMIGFMGAFTTFSAFILETGELVRAAQWLTATANFAAQNGLGFMGLAAGIMLGRLV